MKGESNLHKDLKAIADYYAKNPELVSPAKPDQPESVSFHSHWYEGIDEKCACGSYLKDQPQPEELNRAGLDLFWFLIHKAHNKLSQDGYINLIDASEQLQKLLKKEYERGRKEEFEGIQRQFNGKGIQHPDIRKARADTLNEVEKIMTELSDMKLADNPKEVAYIWKEGFEASRTWILHRIQELKDGNR